MKVRGTTSRVKHETCCVFRPPSNPGYGVDGVRESGGCWSTFQPDSCVSFAVTVVSRLGYFGGGVCFPSSHQVGCEFSGFPFSSSDTSRTSRQLLQPRMLWTPILALILLPLTLVSAALEVEHDKLVKLAAASNGVIKLDEPTFNLLTHPKRTWSAAIQFTAMDKRRRCNPCRCVPRLGPSSRPLILPFREFGPAWDTVAKSWTKTPTEHRNSHFFATIDFDTAQPVFQRVSFDW